MEDHAEARSGIRGWPAVKLFEWLFRIAVGSLIVTAVSIWLMMPGIPDNLALRFVWSSGLVFVVLGMFLIPVFVVAWLREWYYEWRHVKESRRLEGPETLRR